MAETQPWRIVSNDGRLYVDVADVATMFRHYAHSGLTGPQRLSRALQEQATRIELHCVDVAIGLGLDPYEVIRNRT